MKAELIAQEVFTVQVGGHQIEGMRVVSKWNGLMELRNAAGEVLIMTSPDRSLVASAFDTLFGDVFRTAAETKAAGAIVVAGSTGLLARLRPADPGPAPAPASAPPA